MKHILTLLLLIALASTQNIAQQSSDSGLLVTMKRGNCFGGCPVYMVSIFGDGTVIYEGKDFVKVKGKRTHKISKNKVQRLIREFQRIHYFSLKDKYTEDENGLSFTDGRSTTTSIRLNGRSKEVYNYYGAPKSLERLEKMIDNITGVSKFIGQN